MILTIRRLSGAEHCNIKINNLFNIYKILDLIISNLDPYSTFSILSEEHKLLFDFLIDDNTTELVNYITNIYNSSTTNHTLYIKIEEYFDDKDRSLQEYQNYLKNLSYYEYIILIRQTGLSIRNKHLLIKILTKNGSMLKFLNEEIKKDKNLVLIAVKDYPLALEDASEELKNDKEIVLAAVTKNGEAIYYASEECIGDYEIVLAAVKNYPLALEEASEELRNNKEIVLAAVTKNGKALYYASDECIEDYEIVLAAVKNYGNALKWVSEELQNDKEIVLEAIKQDYTAYQYVSEELKNDRDILLVVNKK